MGFCRRALRRNGQSGFFRLGLTDWEKGEVTNYARGIPIARPPEEVTTAMYMQAGLTLTEIQNNDPEELRRVFDAIVAIKQAR